MKSKIEPIIEVDQCGRCRRLTTKENLAFLVDEDYSDEALDMEFVDYLSKKYGKLCFKCLKEEKDNRKREIT